VKYEKSWNEQAVVLNAMRRAFRTYPPYKECLRRAKSEYFIMSQKNTPMRRVEFTCAKCLKKFKQKEIAVDHIDPVVDPMAGVTTYDNYAKRLFCSLDNLQVLCNIGSTSCHKAKSKAENALRSRK